MTKLTGMRHEQAYSDALLAVAQGLPRDETRGELIDRYPDLLPVEITTEMDAAYEDALRQGVEREDIDPSWHTR